MVILEYVDNKNDIMLSLNNFNKEAKNNLDLAPELLIRTTYWVYDTVSKTFGPNKFIAHKNMTFNKYESALEGNFDGLLYFDGGRARKNIERILSPYEPDSRLTDHLIDWAESILHPGVLNGVNEQKWKFTQVR